MCPSTVSRGRRRPPSLPGTARAPQLCRFRVLALICSFLHWTAHLTKFARVSSAFLSANRLNSSWPPDIRIQVRPFRVFQMEASKIIQRLVDGYQLRPHRLTLDGFPATAFGRIAQMTSLRRLDVSTSGFLACDVVCLQSLQLLTHLLLSHGISEDSPPRPHSGAKAPEKEDSGSAESKNRREGRRKVLVRTSV